MDNQNQIMPFEQAKMRDIEHEGTTWFSVVDVIEIFTDSATPRKYWNTLKSREPQLP